MVDRSSGICGAGLTVGPSRVKLPRGWKPKITLRSIPERSMIKGAVLLEFSPTLLRTIPAGEEMIGSKRFLNANPQNVYSILGRIRSKEGSIESLLKNIEHVSGRLMIKFLTEDNWQIAWLHTFKASRNDQILFMTNEFRPMMSDICPVLGIFNSESVLAEFERFGVSALGRD